MIREKWDDLLNDLIDFNVVDTEEDKAAQKLTRPAVGLELEGAGDVRVDLGENLGAGTSLFRWFVFHAYIIIYACAKCKREIWTSRIKDSLHPAKFCVAILEARTSQNCYTYVVNR